MKQNGGLALRNPEKYTEISSNKEKYAAALNEMIKKAIKLKCLSYESLAGFIFVIEVNESDAVFNSLDVDGTFTKPVTVILLKLIMLTNIRYNASTNFIMNIYDRGYNKKIVDKEEFTRELNEQYNIYKKTLSYNNIPICPSIIYDNVFTGIPPIKSYLFTLANKIHDLYGNERNITALVINSLIDVYSGDSRQRRKGIPLPDLGIIGMEFAKGYTTFDTYLNSIAHINQHTKAEEVNENVLVLNNCETDCRIISAIIVNIIRLFICAGIIHEDLHSKNIMVQKELQKCLLIDFGVIDNITEYQPYKGEIANTFYIFSENKKRTQKVSVSALNKYLSSQLGTSYKYIGQGEQIFMQDYLYNVREKDARCKKILILFLLILISERQLSFIIRELPVNYMNDFINVLGLHIKPTFKQGSNQSVKDIYMFNYNSLHNDSVTFDAWINDAKNISPSYKFFFKNIFLHVYETLNDYYKFQNFEPVVGESVFTDVPDTVIQNPDTVIQNPDAVVRIGLDPEESTKYRTEANKYDYETKSTFKKGGAKSKSTFKKGGAKSKSTFKKGGAKSKSTFKKGGAKSKSTFKKGGAKSKSTFKKGGAKSRRKSSRKSRRKS